MMTWSRRGASAASWPEGEGLDRPVEAGGDELASQRSGEEGARHAGAADHGSGAGHGRLLAVVVVPAHPPSPGVIAARQQTFFPPLRKPAPAAALVYSGPTMGDKYQRMLDLLLHADDWVTASELAERLGVTTRSVRSYVAAAKSAAHPLPLLTASTAGYRIDRDAYAEFAARDRRRDQAETPQDRLHHLVRRLAEAPEEGLDVHGLADSLFVSDSTLEADLRRVKALAEENGAVLVRSGSQVRLSGTESATRRLLSRLLQRADGRAQLDLESIEAEFGVTGLGPFKTELIRALEADGFFVNEYGTDAVLLHVAIAVDRARRDQRLPDEAAGPIADRFARIVATLERSCPSTSGYHRLPIERLTLPGTRGA